MKGFYDVISRGDYPGRGIALGRAADGRECAIYFIMGRSENSRNRIFARENDSLYTRAYDESKLKDPSLVIYRALARQGGRLIVTNGDQTDTVLAELKNAQNKNASGFGAFTAALMRREFEPDMPNCTPRISALHEETLLAFSILKCENERGEGCARQFFTYPKPDSGEGYFISTYSGLNPSGALKPYAGEPEKISFPDTGAALARGAFNALSADNRVALYARFWREGESEAEHIIINKLEEKQC